MVIPAVPASLSSNPGLFSRAMTGLSNFSQSKNFMPMMRNVANFGAVLAPRNPVAQSMAGFADDMVDRRGLDQQQVRQDQLYDAAIKWLGSGSTTPVSPVAGTNGGLGGTTVKPPATPTVPVQRLQPTQSAFNPTVIAQPQSAGMEVRNAAQMLAPQKPAQTMLASAPGWLGTRPGFTDGTGSAASPAPSAQPLPMPDLQANPVAPQPTQTVESPAPAAPAPMASAMNPLVLALAMRPQYVSGMSPDLYVKTLEASSPYGGHVLGAQELMFNQAEAQRKATEPRLVEGPNGRLDLYYPDRRAVEMLRPANVNYDWMNVPGVGLVRTQDGNPNPEVAMRAAPKAAEWEFDYVPNIGYVRRQKGSPNYEVVMPATPKAGDIPEMDAADRNQLLQTMLANAMSVYPDSLREGVGQQEINSYLGQLGQSMNDVEAKIGLNGLLKPEMAEKMWKAVAEGEGRKLKSTAIAPFNQSDFVYQTLREWRKDRSAPAQPSGLHAPIQAPTPMPAPMVAPSPSAGKTYSIGGKSFSESEIIAKAREQNWTQQDLDEYLKKLRSRK